MLEAGRGDEILVGPLTRRPLSDEYGWTSRPMTAWAHLRIASNPSMPTL
jgi:hypothetical protein